MRRRRLVAVVMVAVLALVTATGCQNRFGAAAVIGSDRISASDVDAYVAEVIADDQANYPRDVVRAAIVTTIVRNRLLELLAGQLGLRIDPEALAAAKADHDNISNARDNGLPVSLLAESNQLFGAISHHLDPRFDVNGIRVLDAATGAEMNSQIRTLLGPVLEANPVTVNPAYGTFNPDNLRVYPPGVAVPATEPWIRPSGPPAPTAE